MGIKKRVTFIDDDGFEFLHEPVDGTLTITETPDGYEARYLVTDDNYEMPSDWDDEGFFLAHYHRQFWVSPKYIEERDLANYYRRDFSDYDDEKHPFDEKWWVFPVSAYIHSGVWLSLGNSFACDPGGWDTSHVGAAFCGRAEWKTEEEARKAAEGLIDEWNKGLSGEVYGIVKETYDKDKNPDDHDACWGFYGYEYAMESLKTEL